jgi:hypothetical protein
MIVDHLPADLTVPSFGPRIVCTGCGERPSTCTANWRGSRSALVVEFEPSTISPHTGALKELFLQAAENVGDRLKIGENGERLQPARARENHPFKDPAKARQRPPHG